MFSPLLFNLIAGILKPTARKGVVTCLVPELVEGGLNHFRYADDSVLFMENFAHNIANLRFLFFFCFIGTF